LSALRAGASEVGQPKTERQRSQSSRAPDLFFDQLALVTLGTSELSRALAKETGVAMADLKKQGVKLEELEGLATAYREHETLRSCALTPSALAKWAPALRAKISKKPAPPCEECGVGGGLHAEGCSIATKED
jgi:hypothetical protein